MSMAIFNQTMKWVDRLIERRQQAELNLMGIGESLMNPHIVEMVKIAREHQGDRPIHMSTNGILLTQELARDLKIAGLSTMAVSGHDAYHAAKAIRILKEAGLYNGYNMDYILQPHDWSGRVEWFVSAIKYPCPWIRTQMAAIQWDGSISSCCMDAYKEAVMGHVNDLEDFDEITLKPYFRCQKCHQVV